MKTDGRRRTASYYGYFAFYQSLLAEPSNQSEALTGGPDSGPDPSVVTIFPTSGASVT